MLSLVLKSAGGVIIFGGGLLTAKWLNEKLDKTLSFADLCIAFVKCIREQVDAYAMPVSEILELGRREGFLEGIFRKWENAKSFRELAENIKPIDFEIKKSITKFLNGFGRVSRAEEIKECDECLHILSARRNYLADNLQKQKKINTVLSIASSLALIILML